VSLPAWDPTRHGVRYGNPLVRWAGCLGNGWDLVELVDDNGDRWPWISPHHVPASGVDGCACHECAPHEQTGPMGAWHVADLMAARCGRPRSNGRPCRSRVRERGEPCYWHREAGPT
jgi:hypothetical protein